MLKSKSTFTLNLIIGLICALIGYLLTLINDKIYSDLESILSYKLILILLILSILYLTYTIIYSKTFLANKTKEREEENDHKTIMKNLSIDERMILYEFLKQNKKFLELELNATISNMESNGILYNPFVTITTKLVKTKYTYHINEWAWEYIHKYKNEFSQKMLNKIKVK